MGHYRKDMITIMMTNTCNLDCKYCYVEKNQENIKTIDINFAKAAIKDYFKDNESPAVRFFADGEPTLAFNKIIEIKEYALSITDKNVTFELQTNGVFSEDVCNWIRDNIDIVFISFDGPPEVNDILRGKSYIIEENIKRLVKSDKVILGLRATLSSLNYKIQKEYIDYLNNIGVKILFSDLIFPKVGESDSEYALKYQEFIDTFVEAREYAEGLGIFYSTMYAANFDEEVEVGCRACLPTPHLTVDGYVTCCDMCTSGNSSLSDLIYGEFDESTLTINYDFEKMEKIKSRNKYNITECRECEVSDYCAGACMGEAVNETGDILGVKDESCLAIKYLWRKLGGQPIELPYLHP